MFPGSDGGSSCLNGKEKRPVLMSTFGCTYNTARAEGCGGKNSVRTERRRGSTGHGDEKRDRLEKTG